MLIKNLLAGLLLLSLPVIHHAKSVKQVMAVNATEEQKITHLIAYVRNLKQAKFIRNGSEYAPVEAADHLAMKRKKAGAAVKTAREFISKVASGSSMSGKPYLIKYADGKVVKVRDVLVAELARFEKG